MAVAFLYNRRIEDAVDVLFSDLLRWRGLVLQPPFHQLYLSLKDVNPARNLLQGHNAVGIIAGNLRDNDAVDKGWQE